MTPTLVLLAPISRPSMIDKVMFSRYLKRSERMEPDESSTIIRSSTPLQAVVGMKGIIWLCLRQGTRQVNSFKYR